MKFRIEEIDRRNTEYIYSAPLTYRIAIKLYDNEIVLTREYFYYGYNDGETIDNFYFDNEVGWNNGTEITRCTFITRNFDEKYLKEKEELLIETFYEKISKSINSFQNKKLDAIKKYDRLKEKYKQYQNCDLFLKYQRKQKLKQLNVND